MNKKVLRVCQDNSARSQMAEAFLEKFRRAQPIKTHIDA